MALNRVITYVYHVSMHLRENRNFMCYIYFNNSCVYKMNDCNNSYRLFKDPRFMLLKNIMLRLIYSYLMYRKFHTARNKNVHISMTLLNNTTPYES
jgi:hypothetical protein